MPKDPKKSFVYQAMDALKANMEDYGGTSFFFVAGQRTETGEAVWEIWSSNKMDPETIVKAFKSAADADNFRQLGRKRPH